MVLILDVRSDIGAHVYSERHLFRLTTIENFKYILKKKKMLSFTMAQRVVSYHLIKAPKDPV